MVKFQNSAHLQVASEKLRYFETANGFKIRFLPYENNLFRGDISSMVDSSINKSSMTNNSMLDDDKENQTFDELNNLPDNSNLQCNLCVTGLDESITSEDLHLMFQQFGELKSCKVSQDPKTGKSKCYGYVWFTTEKACAKALEASSYLPYEVKLFKSFCLRACEPQFVSNKCSVSISGYPASFTE